MIYLDNAATTYPKPFSVLETVYRANRKYAYNSGRGGYRESVQTAEKIFAVRDYFSSNSSSRMWASSAVVAA